MSGFILPVVPKQNAVAGDAPTTTVLALGEIALNIRDGILYASVKLDGTTNTVMRLAGPVSALLPNVGTAKTAAYTAAQSDNNSTIVFNSASALAITLPSLTAGTTITVAQRGTGKVTWTVGSGVTVTAYPSTATGTAGQGAQMTFYYDSATTVLAGGAIS
jgi:hypothetical protein